MNSINRSRDDVDMTLISRINNDPFDDDLIEEVLMDSSEQVALAAIARADCPSELLVDLSQNKSSRVRVAVAQHVNLPPVTRDRLSRDQDPAVANNFIHYIPKERVQQIKQQGLKGIGRLYRDDPERYRERLYTYARFLDKENPTPEEVMEGIRKFREHPHGDDAIFGYPHKIDLEKSKRLKEWLGDKIPIRVDVDKAMRDGILERVRNLDAPPVDYSKVKDKGPALVDIPHPSIIPKGGVIPPEYLLLDGIRKLAQHILITGPPDVRYAHRDG